MSKVLGIVAEYNPFHNGHLYHLQKSKELTGCDYSVAVISGNFTQRGSTSIIDKWSKTEMAILNGIDLVIELPTLYAISSAENFADGAIKILNSLGIIDYISFGAETDNIEVLENISDILYNEPDKYKKLLKKELKIGLSFPKARENAVINYLTSSEELKKSDNKLDISNYENVLSSPNNILGIEYLKALKKYNSNIKVVSIPRKEVAYNSTNLSNNIASSTAIREFLKNNDLDNIKKVMPKNCYSILNKNIKEGNIITDLKVFEKEIIYNLRKISVEDISNLPDVNEGLEFLIKDASNSCNNLESLISLIKSKRYTSTRIQRILLYSLIGITKKDIEIAKNTQPYIRVLGFNSNGEKLLTKIATKENFYLPIITSVKKFTDTNKNNDFNYILNKDILSTNIYALEHTNNFESNLDFKNKIIKL